jgi:hypothetical protein
MFLLAPAEAAKSRKGKAASGITGSLLVVRTEGSWGR